MSDFHTNRRRFLKDIVAGTALVAAGPAACAPADSETAESTPFADAWRSARSEQERWQVVREQFLLEPGYVYLNTGS